VAPAWRSIATPSLSSAAAVFVAAPRVVDGAMVAAVENFLTANAGHSDNILHDVELRFPTLSYRDFFIAHSRWRAAEAMLRGSKVRGRS
jgi:hypothetical protein